MTENHKVLIVVTADAFARQMARWALALKRGGKWEPVVHVSQNSARHFAGCSAAGIRVLSCSGHSTATAGASPVTPAPPGIIPSLRRSLRDIQPLRSVYYRIRLSQAMQTWRAVRELRSAIRRTRKLLLELDIRIMFLTESWPAHLSPAYLRAARLAGIPVVTQPIEKAIPRHFADAYMYDPSRNVGGSFSRLVALRYPHWVHEYRGRSLLHMPAPVVLAMEWLGIAPRKPWRLVGNDEDICAVSGSELEHHYVNAGVPPSKLLTVGTAEHDIMFAVGQRRHELRRELYARLDLSPDNPLILSPLPPDHYVSGRPECDFAEYRELLDFWVTTLSSVPDYNVVLSLHPGHTYDRDPASWSFLNGPRLKVCLDDIATLIPLCDLFVCGGYSSTAQWAIAAGVPVINYDVYRFGYESYRGTPGVLDIQEQGEFVGALRKLTSDSAYYEIVAAKQRADAARWGVLDGKAASRMAALFDGLTGADAVSPTDSGASA